jgi:hypothetical protein
LGDDAVWHGRFLGRRRARRIHEDLVYCRSRLVVYPGLQHFGRAYPRRWPYGVAFRLVTGNRPIDDVQPSAMQLVGEEAYYQKTK